METIKNIINDSEYLSRLSEDNTDDISYLKIGIVNFDNIVKLYQNNYDFTKDELLVLLEDLRFIGSIKIKLVLIILKYKNVDENEISIYLMEEYNNILKERINNFNNE